MLQTAGTGIVMANGRPDVQALIPGRCGSNMEDGVAQYILKNILRDAKEPHDKRK